MKFRILFIILLFVSTVTQGGIRDVKPPGVTAAGLGDVVGPGFSVDSEIAIWDGITGLLLKRFAGTGILQATGGVISIATTTGTGAIVLAMSPTVQTPIVSDGALFNLLADNNITVDASTNPRMVTTGVIRINHTPAITGTRPITLSIDAAGFGDTHAISADVIANGIGAGEQNHLFDVNINTANSTGGEIHGIAMSKTGAGSVSCTAVEAYPGVNAILQRTGSETAIEQAFSYNGAYTDITANLSSAASDVQLFAANGDIVYIGNASIFNSLHSVLSIAASGAGVKPTFEYSAGGGSWTVFAPTDGTNGFRNIGGTIAWGTLTGWATDTVNAVGSKYWVRITRTQNTLATPPTEDTIKYIASVNYGWDKDGDITSLTYNALTLAPQTNGFTIAGGTTSKMLTVPLDASVSGTNTGDNAANSSTTYIGTTAIALNRASAPQDLTGITSIDGNASTVTTNANLTGHVTSTGNATVLGSFSSANLAGALTNETGSGASVFAVSPTLSGNINLPGGIWTSSGDVGIGTAVPTEYLHIYKGTQTGEIKVLLQNDNAQAADASAYSMYDALTNGGSRIQMGSYGTNHSNSDFAGYGKIVGYLNGLIVGAYEAGGKIKFWTGGAGGSFERMRLTDTGLSVGSSTVTAKLEVWNGGFRMSDDDVSHGITDWVPDKTFMQLRAYSDTAGGINFIGLSDTDLMGFVFQGIVGTNTPTVPAVRFIGQKKNGIAVQAMGNTEQVFNFQNYGVDLVTIMGNGNLGIGTITAGNIITCPIASATDPIADAWTVHCLEDYKEIDLSMASTELRSEALTKVKASNVSKFTKKVYVEKGIVEDAMKQEYKKQIKSKSFRDLADYTAATGVKISDESYINDVLEGLWNTRTGKDVEVDIKVAEEEIRLKQLPKFSRMTFGLTAENAPAEAQVRDAQGNLQGVDPYALIGILWAAVQAQEERIQLLEGN